MVHLPNYLSNLDATNLVNQQHLLTTSNLGRRYSPAKSWLIVFLVASALRIVLEVLELLVGARSEKHSSISSSKNQCHGSERPAEQMSVRWVASAIYAKSL